MKRLVWLLIAVVGTALAQVPPVVSPFAPGDACCCGTGPAGTCGMPDCAPTPTACASGLSLQVSAAQRAEARRLSPAPRRQREKFYVQFVPRASGDAASRASLRAAVSAREPLFKVHCSFLI